jgi:hypothetical protein
VRTLKAIGGFVGALFAATLCASAEAQSAPPADGARDGTEACIAAHVEAQRLRRDSKLRAAKAALVRCSDPTCPHVIADECTQLFDDTAKAIPTLVFSAQDADGHDVADARVTEADAVVMARLDGKEIEVDPGEHHYVFERVGAAPVVRTIVVKEGERLRRVTVKLGDGASPEGSATRELGPAFWIVGTVGLVGVTTFGALATAGLLEKNGLDDEGCAPRCDRGDVDRVRGLFLGADIALGVGLAGLGIAPILYFTSPAGPRPARASGGGLSWGVTF